MKTRTRQPEYRSTAQRSHAPAAPTGAANDVRTASEPTHSHHWVIEEASGRVSRGSCRECHAERDFQNWLPELDFVTRAERNVA